MIIENKLDIFIKNCKLKHLDKYNYSLVDYNNNNTKVKIICPIHGIFEQVPKSHLKGIGISKIISESTVLTIENQYLLNKVLIIINQNTK